MPSSGGTSLRPLRALIVLAVCIIIGALINLGVAALLIENADFVTVAANVPAGSLDAVQNDHHWHVDVRRTFGAMQVSSHHKLGSGWSPHQAAGPPDAAIGTDSTSAWASQSADATPEWLELDYATPVAATAIEIHETYAPGAVCRITFFDDRGRGTIVWEGKARSPGVPARVNVIQLTTPPATKRIKLDVDSRAIPSWNEIDAVALVDAVGAKHWATGARASSWYGTPAPPTALTHAGLADQIRPFGFLRIPTGAVAYGRSKQENRVVQAFGWPALTLIREDSTANAAAATGNPAPVVILSGSAFTPAAPAAVPPGAAAWGRAAPIWRGAVINTAVYGIVVLFLYLALTAPLFLMRQLTRMRDGCCIECGYQLGYDFKAGCPNCGWRRTGDFPPVT